MARRALDVEGSRGLSTWLMRVLSARAHPRTDQVRLRCPQGIGSGVRRTPRDGVSCLELPTAEDWHEHCDLHADGGRHRCPHAAKLHRRTLRRGRHERAPRCHRARDGQRAGARAAVVGKADLDDAVRAAQEAFPAWRRTPTIERARWHVHAAPGAIEHQERHRAPDHAGDGQDAPRRARRGRPRDRDGRGACAVPTTMQGRNLENVATQHRLRDLPPADRRVRRDLPFNFPAMVPIWFLPFAIACGNTFVLKPSEQVPITQQIAFEMIDDARPARRASSTSSTAAARSSRAILDHPGIARVSFVGSATVAQLVYSAPARAGKRVQALGGAKNHMVVMPDAVMDKTVDGHHRLGVRRGRPALHGRLGRRHGRRRPGRAADALRRGRRGAARRRRHGAGRRGRAGRLGDRARAHHRLDRQGRGRGRDVVRRRPRPRRRPRTAPSSARRSSTTSRRTWRSPRRRSSARCSRSSQADSLDEAIEIVNARALRQRHVDLHRVGRRRAPLPPRRAGRHDRRQHRRRGAGGVLPVLGLEGLLLRRPARPRRATRSTSTPARRPSRRAGTRGARPASSSSSDPGAGFVIMTVAPSTCRVRLGA